MKKKMYALTLLEIMIVIVLIGLIGSVIGFNMKGSLDEGRAFKTEQAMNQLEDILMLEVAKGNPIESVVNDKVKFLKDSGLVKDPDNLLKDGWQEPFEISCTKEKITISSNRLSSYRDRK